MKSTKRLHRPVVGPMDLGFENLDIPGGSGQRLIARTAEPGSPCEAALRLLGGVTFPENTAVPLTHGQSGRA